MILDYFYLNIVFSFYIFGTAFASHLLTISTCLFKTYLELESSYSVKRVRQVKSCKYLVMVTFVTLA